MSRRGRRTSIGAQFAPRRIDMLRSPAYCALSLSARRVLDRLEIEMADHGGTDNGKLPVTYDDYERYGIHRQAIYPAIRETVALGFVEIMEEGVAGGAEFRKPTLFRLTYRHTDTAKGDGTHEWMGIQTDAEAKILAVAARSEKPSQKQILKYGSRQKSVRKPYRKSQILSTETTTTVHSTESTTTIDISSVPSNTPREARSLQSAVASGAAPTKTRSDVLQARLASRLGADGWEILMNLDEADLERLLSHEDDGLVDEAAITDLCFRYCARHQRKGTAA